MLKPSTLQKLQKGKSLLAFSGGADSTALLFLLLEHKISFDIAIVDYGLREQSKDEVAYAKELACEYNFTCHSVAAPKFEKNFEANARSFRYSYFESLIKEHGYTNLLTAHHLGDRLEWFLMQLTKGAGLAELLGMQDEENRNGYTLLRPLLHTTKESLIEYLLSHAKNYFTDTTNADLTYKRNYFRHSFSNPLLEAYASGIAKSFEYLERDKNSLIERVEITEVEEFAYFKSSGDKRSDIFAIDKYLKTRLHMPTAKERELLENERTVVLGRKFLVTRHVNFLFIAPFSHAEIHMPKEFKEKMRLLRIEPKLRPYLYKNPNILERVELLLRGV